MTSLDQRFNMFYLFSIMSLVKNSCLLLSILVACVFCYQSEDPDQYLDSSDQGLNSLVDTVDPSQDFSVLRIQPKTKHQVNYLRELEANSSDYDLDFWRSPSNVNHSVDVMMANLYRKNIERQLHYQNIQFEEIIDSVESLIMDERLEMLRNGLHYDADWKRPLSFFRNYHNLEEINNYLTSLEQEYPNRVMLETIGHSFEKRPMRILKIGERNREDKKIIWIDGGIHAREWISPATALYIADQLVREADKNEDIKQLVEQFDFYILPVVNPDGYSYTFSNQRLWRKTRSIRTGLLNSICYGADPNRNFGFHWGEVGSSSFPCSQVYAGAHAFSEPETRAMADKIMSIRERMVAYFALHSYSQLILMPWGYTHTLPVAYWDMEDKAKKARERLHRRYGTEYSFGSSTNILYAAAGGADDWVHGVAKVKYTYTIELRDTGNRGFLLPPTQIIPTGEETFDAICNMTAEIGREHGVFVEFSII